jgi:hypothetical protein
MTFNRSTTFKNYSSQGGLDYTTTTTRTHTRVAGDGNIPPLFSRFGYEGDCANGYCLGVQSIPVNVDPGKRCKDYPQGLAPARFYTPEYKGKQV